jgi:hypothetical protein
LEEYTRGEEYDDTVAELRVITSRALEIVHALEEHGAVLETDVSALFVHIMEEKIRPFIAYYEHIPLGLIRGLRERARVREAIPRIQSAMERFARVCCSRDRSAVSAAFHDLVAPFKPFHAELRYEFHRLRVESMDRNAVVLARFRKRGH